MLSFEDCLALCNLAEEEIEAIAEHEHLPEIVAAELGTYLQRHPDGSVRISTMIREDLEVAMARGDAERASRLVSFLSHYVETHGGGALKKD